jgi:hypothetical protein
MQLQQLLLMVKLMLMVWMCQQRGCMDLVRLRLALFVWVRTVQARVRVRGWGWGLMRE